MMLAPAHLPTLLTYGSLAGLVLLAAGVVWLWWLRRH